MGIKENGPKVTYLIFRRGSTGESFFFHGLIDFVLFFYTGLKNLGSLLSQIFFCLQPGILALVRLPATNPAQKLTFLLSISADGGESPLPFWGLSQSFGFSLPPSWSADFLGLLDATQVRLLGTNICWSSSRPLWPTFSLNGHLFDGLILLIQREDSINLISIVSVGYHVTLLNDKTFLFRAIQFSISMQFSSIWPIKRTLSRATTPGQSGTGNEEVFHFPQSSSITRTSPSDCLVSYPRQAFDGYYPSADVQSVYSIAPADWARPR